MNKITIEISDEVYARLREAAAQGNRLIESVLSDSVTLLFSETNQQHPLFKPRNQTWSEHFR